MLTNRFWGNQKLPDAQKIVIDFLESFVKGRVATMQYNKRILSEDWN